MTASLLRKIEEYNKDPRKCAGCNNFLSYNHILFRNRFCSRKCSGKNNNNKLRITSIKKKEEYSKNPDKCVSCKSPINYDKKCQGNKFCSRSCSATFNNRKVDADLIRRRNEGIRRYYLSAYTHLKSSIKYGSGYHVSWDGKTIFFRSSYEKRILDVLDSIKETYLYEQPRLLYIFHDKTRVYLPDFFIPRLNLIIEAKGEWFQERDKDILECKKKAVLDKGHKYVLMGDKDIRKFEKEKNLESLI